MWLIDEKNESRNLTDTLCLIFIDILLFLNCSRFFALNNLLYDIVTEVQVRENQNFTLLSEIYFNQAQFFRRLLLFSLSYIIQLFSYCPLLGQPY